MHSCQHCGTFVFEGAATCPHCEQAVAAPRRGRSMRQVAAAAAMATALAGCTGSGKDEGTTIEDTPSGTTDYTVEPLYGVTVTDSTGYVDYYYSDDTYGYTDYADVDTDMDTDVDTDGDVDTDTDTDADTGADTDSHGPEDTDTASGIESTGFSDSPAIFEGNVSNPQTESLLSVAHDSIVYPSP